MGLKSTRGFNPRSQMMTLEPIMKARNDKCAVIHLNIRSLNRNYGELVACLSSLSFNPIAICLSETWLNDEQHDPMHFFINKFTTLVTTNRTQRGGGVGIYLRNDIKLVSKVQLEL